jgi:hypothetical protein
MDYKRGKTEIHGDPKDVKPAMWFDLIASNLWIVVLIALLFIQPAASFIPLVWKVVQNKIL